MLRWTMPEPSHSACRFAAETQFPSEGDYFNFDWARCAMLRLSAIA
jgi:hypothetical protein